MKKIFFSWQVDTPSKIGRSMIRDAIAEACNNISTDASIEEAHRDMSVDSDTEGVAGQPPIVDTIFKKIDDSALYVGDVTFVGERRDKRPVPNPNVLIEYGWALKGKGFERVILIMNTAYGEPSDQTLPFNLKHVRWPIRFKLNEGSSQTEINKAKADLVKKLETAIRTALPAVTKTAPEEPAPFPEVTAKDGNARFRAKGESVGFEDDFYFGNEKEIILTDGPAMWFRLIPQANPGKQFPIPDLKSLALSTTNLPPLIAGSGYSFFRAEDGTGSYRKEQVDAKSENSFVYGESIAMAFETGEIWAIETAMLSWDTERLYQGEIEKIYPAALRHYSSFLKDLGIKPPFKWMAGIEGTKGRRLGYATKPGHHRIGEGPKCASNQIFEEGIYDGSSSPTAALMPFFEMVFRKCGMSRPDYLPQE